MVPAISAYRPQTPQVVTTRPESNWGRRRPVLKTALDNLAVFENGREQDCGSVPVKACVIKFRILFLAEAQEEVMCGGETGQAVCQTAVM